MAIMLRSRQQIAKMREAGRLVAETFELLKPHVQPGITTRELDRMAEKINEKLYLHVKGEILFQRITTQIFLYFVACD